MHTHAALCRLAADCGVHILCQKPLAPTLAEASELLANIGSRVRFMVHENWRFRPQYRQVKAWVNAGDLGDVRYCRLATRSSGLLPDEEGRRPALQRQPFLASLSRLIIGEALVHHLDVVTWLMGPMQVASAKAAHGLPQVSGEHAATILLSGDEGRWALVEGDYAAAGYPSAQATDSLELIGQRGSVRFEGSRLTLLSAMPQEAEYNLADSYSRSYAGAIAHFAQCMRRGRAIRNGRCRAPRCSGIGRSGLRARRPHRRMIFRIDVGVTAAMLAGETLDVLDIATRRSSCGRGARK